MFSLVFLIFVAVITGCTIRKEENSDNKIILKCFAEGGADYLKIYTGLIRSFERQNPDIKIKLDISSEYTMKIQTMLAGNVPPDIFMVNQFLFKKFVASEDILNLQPFIEKEKMDLSDFYPQLLKLYSYQGHVYGLPWELSSIGLFYNKHLFDKAGLKYPNETWTWQDMLEAAKKLTIDTDGDGRIDQWGLLVDPAGLEVCYANFIWQNGGDVLNEEKTECLLDRPEAIETFQFLIDLINGYHVVPTVAETSGLGERGEISIFNIGKVAMRYGGYWYIPEIRSAKHFQWDVAPLPRKKNRAVACNGTTFVISSRTKYPEEAWGFVKYLSSIEGQEELIKSGWAIPSRKSMKHLVIQYNEGSPPVNIKSFLIDLAYAHPLPLTENYSEWMNAVRREIELAVLNKQNVQDACVKAKKRVDELLSEIQR